MAEKQSEQNVTVTGKVNKVNKIRKYVDLALSLQFIISVILGYYKDISHMSEYCFISGMLVGITFFISSLHQQKHEKPLNACIYLACVVDIFIIFIATVTIHLNLDGAFRFIHIINPIILMIYWLIFCDQSFMKLKGILSVIAFPLLYMLFAFILFKISGKCPFPASLIFMDYTGLIQVVILAAFVIIYLVFGFLLHMLCQLLVMVLAGK